MNEFYVYGLFDPIETFPFYIGKGKEDRMYKHFMESRKERNLHKDNKIEKIKRQGRKPYAEKLYEDLTEERAYVREWCLINLYYDKLTNIDSTYGSGIRSGKRHPWYGENHTEEWKEKMSEKMTGRSINLPESHGRNVSEALTGKTLPKETRRKISDKMEGRTLSESHKEKLSESKKGENSYNSKITKEEAAEVKWLAKNTSKPQKEIGEKYGISFQSVSAIKNGRSWEHVEAKPVE